MDARLLVRLRKKMSKRFTLEKVREYSTLVEHEVFWRVTAKDRQGREMTYDYPDESTAMADLRKRIDIEVLDYLEDKYRNK